MKIIINSEIEIDPKDLRLELDNTFMNLDDVMSELENYVASTIKGISYERHKENPDLTCVDHGLYKALDLIEQIRRNNL